MIAAGGGGFSVGTDHASGRQQEERKGHEFPMSLSCLKRERLAQRYPLAAQTLQVTGNKLDSYVRSQRF